MTAFGRHGSVGLVQRLRPTRIDAADLLDVVEVVLPVVAGPRLRVELLRRSGAGSVLLVEEDERSMRADLAELADDMTGAGIAPTPEAMTAALRSWIAHRPVTDAAAAADGIAVLDWADATRSAVGWRVVVRRGDLTHVWTPLADAPAEQVDDIRSSATARAGDVQLTLHVEGPVALWSHTSMPVLATTALAAPGRMLTRVADAGLPVDDVHVVVTPQRPVACAGRSVAARLAGETSEANVTLPWARLTTLPWL
ncbi:hypothetical protein SAMN05660662_1558 [Blastococcus aurantiacus]|uniref:Uncharacterized protein n=1 Tax=Blastococcus aurantiacus TaxID=1550231 RepID=A0A1G7JK20_9ACTN|nr:hypothetical protein [Blastococcus aurantiacus]SDF25271.1 hypothetical protein SAMN05660662_1558 [Blastococcus aurantiacus]